MWQSPVTEEVVGSTRTVKRYPRDIRIPFLFSFLKIQCWNSCEVEKVKFDSSTTRMNIHYILALSDGPRQVPLLRKVHSEITNFLQRVRERIPIVSLPFEVNEC